MQIPHQVMGEVTIMSGTHVLKVTGDGCRIVGMDKLQRTLADEFGR